MKSSSKHWDPILVEVKKQKYLVNWIKVKSWREKTLANATQPHYSHQGPKEGGNDATEAGGGNLHRGRGATAWGREDGGDDATKAGGGNLHRGRGATAWGREEGGDEATEAGGGNLQSIQISKASLYQKRR